MKKNPKTNTKQNKKKQIINKLTRKTNIQHNMTVGSGRVRISFAKKTRHLHKKRQRAHSAELLHVLLKQIIILVMTHTNNSICYQMGFINHSNGHISIAFNLF